MLPAMIENVELSKAYRLLNHGPVVLVSSAHGGERNVMTASWCMPLDFDPPRITIVIDKKNYTRALIEASGEFVLNIPGRSLASQVFAAGSRSGRDGDKFEATGLAPRASQVVKAPSVEGCAGWLECRLIPEPHNQASYDLLIAEVVAASADTAAFKDGRWVFEDENLRTLHYVAGGNFLLTGEALDAQA